MLGVQTGGAAKKQLHEDLAMSLGKALNSQDIIATIENGQKAIWSAWNEEDNMRLWEQKLQSLHELEQALGKAAKQLEHDMQLKVLKSTLEKLAKANDGLMERNGKTGWLLRHTEYNPNY